MTNMEWTSFFIGIVSGVVSSFLIFIISQVFYKIIIPWYKKLKYESIDISGTWIEGHDIASDVIQESEININQNINKLNGTINILKIRKQDKERISNKSFNINGFFYNGFLSVGCVNNSNKQIGISNYLMKYMFDGRGLSGYKIYYDVFEEILKTEKIVWIKKNFENENVEFNKDK